MIRGLYYEEFEIGKIYQHALRRTVTEMDNIMFSSLTMNVQPLHLDEEWSKGTIYGQRVVNSIFTLGLVGSFQIIELTMGTTMGNLGFESVRFPSPVFLGDTLRAETTVLAKRESRGHPDAGIVRFEHRGYNQDGTLVCSCERAAMMMKIPTDKDSGAAT